MHPAAGLHVVELVDGNVYLGVLRYDGERVILVTGRNGRPPILTLDDIDDLIPAEIHPDVTWS